MGRLGPFRSDGGSLRQACHTPGAQTAQFASIQPAHGLDRVEELLAAVETNHVALVFNGEGPGQVVMSAPQTKVDRRITKEVQSAHIGLLLKRNAVVRGPPRLRTVVKGVPGEAKAVNFQFAAIGCIKMDNVYSEK
jgi:hypothetical protein